MVPRPPGIDLFRRLGISVTLALYRVAMPRRYRTSSLDGLLRALSGAGRNVPKVMLAAIERDVGRVERLLSRAPELADSCLYRALARYAVLRRAGFPAVFVMGLPRATGDAPGHAWVEVFGRPFAEPSSVADLAVTFRYPPAADA